MSRWTWAACAGIFAIASVAGAQSSVPTLTQLLDQLRSDSFADRAAATEALVAGTNFDNGDLVRALKSGTLDAESSTRIAEALRRRFFATTRAAIGITFAQGDPLDPLAPTGAPRIAVVHDALPAGRSGLLRVGDEIIEVEGEPLENRINPHGTRRLQIAVFSRQPGESIRLKIRRPHAPPHLDEAGNLALDPGDAFTIIEAEIPLGRFDQLAVSNRERLLAAQNGPQVRIQDGVEILHIPPAPDPQAPNQVQVNAPGAVIIHTDPAHMPESGLIADAWAEFARRAGITADDAPLNDLQAGDLDWESAGTGIALGRPQVRGGGRVLSGPISTARGFAALLRDQANIERNQLILRNLAGNANINAAVRQREADQNQGVRIVQFGEGPNRIHVRVLENQEAPRNAGGRARSRLISEEQFQAMCASVASEIATVEAELRRLTQERAVAVDDLSTVQIVDERIAALRERWDTLRAEAAAITAPPAALEADTPSSFR